MAEKKTTKTSKACKDCSKKSSACSGSNVNDYSTKDCGCKKSDKKA